VRATRVSRHLAAPRSVVWAALVDADAIARWRVPREMDCVVHRLDAREGGGLRVSLTYRSPDRQGKTRDRTDTYDGVFVRLVPGELLVETDRFETDDPRFQGPMTITITLAEADPAGRGGTDLVAVHAGLPDGVSEADNEVGWHEALDRLAGLVEPPQP
jgi:uncharacterized protein YndB with AHSA1/START domain